ncbi:uncharacterized protein LOC110716966 isoform X4 [Chenopodium quinoa]|uniref:uncharacterized protein LOC110716966 isoform X4 n=1 Tax=Chenopodium quinoa TaxID=63459 RepID=UPI000B776D7F|nr:uncharacterized protein LOC110716966 isoform X4 [Chenopodium quinoa]XP_021751308.1 uncharacterized protein LOC110716966 isoform X4 [Chenopodium quinoa]
MKLKPFSQTSHQSSFVLLPSSPLLLPSLSSLAAAASFSSLAAAASCSNLYLRQAVKKLLTDICRKHGIDCTDFLTSFTGLNCFLSTSTVSTFLQHEPQPTATKNMIHFSQSTARRSLIGSKSL